MTRSSLHLCQMETSRHVYVAGFPWNIYPCQIHLIFSRWLDHELSLYLVWPMGAPIEGGSFSRIVEENSSAKAGSYSPTKARVVPDSAIKKSL